MIHITVAYPNTEGATFDHDYYQGKHMALVRALGGDAVKRLEVDKALATPDPSTKPPWIAAGHLYFETIEAFQAMFAEHGGEIMGDVPNFTDTEASIVISESSSE